MVVMLLKTWKQLGLLLVLCLLFYGAFLLPRSGSAAHIRLFKAPSPPLSDLFGDLHLNGETCEAVFPGLTKDIDDIASLGPFPLKQARNQGPLQIRIHGSQVSSANCTACSWASLIAPCINCRFILFIKKMMIYSPPGL